MNFINETIKQLNQAGLLRALKTIDAIKGAQVKVGPKWYTSFCSNDYLGLAQHPVLRQAMIQATREFGSGSGASRILAGTSKYHRQLEEAVARFKHMEEALIFTSGYVANLAVITALITKNDIIFCDELNHASLVDGARLTKAKLVVYKHQDMNSLEKGLSKSMSRGKLSGRGFIITDTVFSMDGDMAHLDDIVQLARKYGVYTIVDEAHGTGVLGPQGRGVAEHFGVEKKIDIIIGTFSKAVGSIGGFVTGSRKLMTYLRSKSRPFIFTTSLPPGVCAASCAGLRLIQTKPILRRQLWQNTQYIKGQLELKGFDLRNSASPIIPIIIGNARKTLSVAENLWREGIFTPAVRPPTVPPEQSRLRLTITNMHSKNDLDRLLDLMVRAIDRAR
jgi:8-amino-7-oxononanoate synthase